MKCRFIDTGLNDAYTNMAIDESILNCCEEPTLRVYQWSSPSISIGYNQNVKNEINLGACRKNGIKIVRRLTGGKAVLHENDITYSFIVPEDKIPLPKDVVESYRIIANALVIALQRIGVNAQVMQQRERLKTPICFNSSNWYELTAKGKKISGSAQRRLQGKIMQHGPILMDFDFEKNSRLFSLSNNSSDAKALADSLKKKITSIKHQLVIDISYREMASAIKHGFQENFGFKFMDETLTKREAMLSEKLRSQKYSTDSWNFRT